MTTFSRSCPTCGSVIYHKSERSCRQMIKDNRQCGSCAAKSRISAYGFGEHFVKYTIKGCNKGTNNPFYGKTHSETTKEKIRNRDKGFFNDQNYKEKMSKLTSGNKNPMYGKSVYQVWLKKFGEEKANELMESFRDKQRINSSGENNPMYGKPSPQGSGNGWSGWYKNWFFRSLKELSYVVNVLELNGDLWDSAESLGIKIPYVDWAGNTRNYIPDFLVNSTLLVEIKPSKLKSSVTVRKKQEAAEQYAKNKNWEYVLIDPPLIKKEQIKELYDLGLLTFIDRYETLYKKMDT